MTYDNRNAGGSGAEYFTSTATTYATAASYQTASWDMPTYTTATRGVDSTYTVERPDVSVGGDTTNYEGDMANAAANNQYTATTGYTDVNTYAYGDTIPTEYEVRDAGEVDPGAGPMTTTSVTSTYDAASGYDLSGADYNTVATGAVKYMAPVDERGRSLYDLQRQQIIADTEKERERRQEALQRQLAAMGLEDSGVALQQAAQLNQELSRETSQKLNEVTAQELGAAEKFASEEEQRRFERGERLGGQEFTSAENKEERLMAMDQFDTEMGLKKDFFNLEAQGQYNDYQQKLKEFKELQYQYDISTGVKKQELAQQLVMQERDLNASADRLRSEIESSEKIEYMNNSEKARQFDLTLFNDVKKTAAELAFRREELGKTLTLEEAKMYNDMTLKSKEYEEKKYQFDIATGLQKEELFADLMKARNELIESTNQLSMKIEAEKNLEQQAATNDYYLELADNAGQASIEALRGRIAVSLTNLEANVAEQKEINKLRRDRYFNMGKSGQVMTAEELSTLKELDPTAYDAYKAGQSGLSILDMEREQEQKDKFIEAAILNLAEYKGEEFMNQLEKLYLSLGMPLPGPAGTGAVNPNPLAPDTPVVPGAGETFTPNSVVADRRTIYNPDTGQEIPLNTVIVPNQVKPDGSRFTIEMGGTQVDPKTGLTVTIDPYQGDYASPNGGNGLNDSIARRPQGTRVPDMVAAHYSVNGWPENLTSTISVPGSPNPVNLNSAQLAELNAARAKVTSDPNSIRFLSFNDIVDLGAIGIQNADKTAIHNQIVLVPNAFGKRGFAPMYTLKLNNGRIFGVNLETGQGSWLDSDAAKAAAKDADKEAFKPEGVTNESYFDAFNIMPVQ